MQEQIKNPTKDQVINGVLYKYTKNPMNPDFIALCRKLDKVIGLLKSTDTWAFNYELYLRHNAKDVENIWLAYADGKIIGCAGFRWHSRRTAEVRRVFVDDSYQGKSIGSTLLRLVEAGALEQGYTVLVLQTKPALAAAVRMYEHLGFNKRISMGQYAAKPAAICMAKVIYPKERIQKEGLPPMPPLPGKIQRYIDA